MVYDKYEQVTKYCSYLLTRRFPLQSLPPDDPNKSTDFSKTLIEWLLDKTNKPPTFEKWKSDCFKYQR